MPNLRKRHIRQNPGFRTAAAVAALCSVAMLSGGCANDPIAGDSTAPTTRYDFPRLGLSAAALTRAQTCDDVVAYFKAAAKEMVSAQQGYGDGGDVFATADAAGSAADGAAPATVPAARESNRTATPESSTAGSSDDKASFDETATGTNNQEAGVDEADMIKTDGRRVVSIRGQELIVVDLDGGAAAVSGRVTLPDGFSAASLFLTGDRVMVLGSSWLQTEDSPAGASGGVRDDAALDMGWSPGASAVQVVEVALGGQPTVVATRSVEGWLTDARMSDGTVRVIVSNSKQPYYQAPMPEYPYSDDERSWEAYAEASTKAMTDYIETTTATDWLPVDDSGDLVTRCADTYLPAENAGDGTVTVLTFADGVDSMESAAVTGTAETVYASTDAIYLATSVWNWRTFAADTDGDAGGTTDLHMFATSGSANATYVASGQISGHVLNQYSMSASDDTLRVATTKGSWGSGESGVMTLRAEGEALQVVGEVWGLGPGETIQSVRFVGDTAYVVTFEQTDPFYVVDVADPANPKVLGELKVPGFSNYLHPVGEHLVLGIGADADDNGMTTGAKVSLYDVSDPTKPSELDTWTATDLAFQAGNDPHAFTWDAERRLAYVIYTDACYGDWERCTYSDDGGAAVFHVSEDTIEPLTRLTHDNRVPDPAPTTTTEPTTTEPATTEPATTVPASTEPATTDAPTTTAPVAAPGVSATEDIAVSEPSIGAPAPTQWVFPITRAFPLGDSVVTFSWWGIGVFSADDFRLTGFAAF